jgi:hypothetical protein
MYFQFSVTNLSDITATRRFTWIQRGISYVSRGIQMKFAAMSAKLTSNTLKIGHINRKIKLDV